MAEAKAAEPDERAAPPLRRPGRNHVINLCCAQSVHEVVEGVARNLEGLGFRVSVVCGAEARAALLGSPTDSNQPTIHVVCVQGSMQERVLKPLRQALATHGGPNHHLFVAVLDVELPLAMVGQIRRFAEEVDRAPGRAPLRPPPPSVPSNEASLTRVVERGPAKPPTGGNPSEGERRRARPLGSRGRPATIPPTAKYRAITASHELVEPDASVPRSRRAPPPLPAKRLPSSPRPTPAPPRSASGVPKSIEAADTAQHARAPARAPADPPEADRIRPRAQTFRFTPPGVKAAEVQRPQSGAVTTVPLADMLLDADKTIVHGVLQEVPRTASTLRLDDPPFPDGPRAPRERPEDVSDPSESEPVEPTMIMAAPLGPPKVVEAARRVETVETTVVAPPPATPPGDELEPSEQQKTLLRSDGSFERASDVMDKIVASRAAASPTGTEPPRNEVLVEPEAFEPAFKSGKTALYGESTPPPAQVPAEADVVVARPSAIPTERHVVVSAADEPKARSQQRRSAPERAAVALADQREVPERGPKVVVTRARRVRQAKSSGYGWLWIMLALLVAGGGWGTYRAGLLDDLLGRGSSKSTTIAEASPPKGPEPTPPSPTTAALPDANADDAGQAAAATTGPEPAATTGSAPDPAEASTGTSGTSTGTPEASTAAPAATGAPNELDPPDGPDAQGSTSSPDEPEPTTPPDAPQGDAPQLTPEELELGPAVDDRSIYMLKTLFATRRQGSATSWRGGWQRCAKLEVEGVKGWRLPHRREMKLVNAVLALPSGIYWTRTVPDDDKSAAYVLDTNNGGLSLFLKQEPTGEVVCVRPRAHPDK